MLAAALVVYGRRSGGSYSYCRLYLFSLLAALRGPNKELARQERRFLSCRSEVRLLVDGVASGAVGTISSSCRAAHREARDSTSRGDTPSQRESHGVPCGMGYHVEMGYLPGARHPA